MARSLSTTPQWVKRIAQATVLCLLMLLIQILDAAPGFAAGGTAEAVAMCQELLPAFVKAPSGLSITVQDSGLGQATGVRLSWPSTTKTARDGEDWVICWFLPRHADTDAWQMRQLDTSFYGLMSRYDIQQLYKLLRVMTYEPQQFGPQAASLPARISYIVQQGINAISLGCVYALIAMGYTLVYGITRVINFAFGEVYMAGAFLMIIGYAVLTVTGGLPAGVAFLGVMLAGALIMAALGTVMEKAVFRPLRGSSLTASLIAAVALAMTLKDTVRLLQGSRTRYLLVDELSTWRIATGTGFDLFLSRGHVLIAAATAVIAALLWWTMMRTRFGRAQRACAQDWRTAALMGVNVDRTIATTFAIGTALVGTAGVFAAAYYGVVNFHMGTIMGVKALTAALLGGIGSLPGAILGGFLIAVTEVSSAAAVGTEWKDIAVFGILVVVLLVRPSGILGVRGLTQADERP